MSRPKSAEGRAIREQILEWVAAYKSTNGYYPTQAEIISGLRLSKGGFLWHLKSLSDQGFISYQPHDFARTLTISRKSRNKLT